MSNNDSRILELKKQIQKKKEELGKSSRFSPITNCSIEIDGIRTNLNASNKEQLTFLLVKLHSYLLASADLELEPISISGYTLEEWITDIKSKVAVLSRKEEETKLKTMEDKLTKLLSDGKKVELELDEIESSL